MISHPGVEKSVKTQLGPASQHILATARLLSEVQSQFTRDEKGETALATLVNRLINSYSVDCGAIGVASATGTGIYTTESAPRTWQNTRFGYGPWSLGLARKFADKQGSYEITPFEGNLIEGNFLWHGFQRGDHLGYKKELGNLWYLMFGWGRKYYLPVGSLDTIKLKVADTGF